MTEKKIENLEFEISDSTLNKFKEKMKIEDEQK